MPSSSNLFLDDNSCEIKSFEDDPFRIQEPLMQPYYNQTDEVIKS